MDDSQILALACVVVLALWFGGGLAVATAYVQYQNRRDRRVSDERDVD